MVIDQSAPLQPAYLTRPTTGQPAKCFYTRPPEGHLCWSSLRGRRECTLYTPVEPPLPPTRKLAKGPKLSLMPSNFSHTYKRCHAKMPPPNPTSHFNLPHFHGIKSQKPQLSCRNLCNQNAGLSPLAAAILVFPRSLSFRAPCDSRGLFSCCFYARAKLLYSIIRR
jgi:hypothetical protein